MVHVHKHRFFCFKVENTIDAYIISGVLIKHMLISYDEVVHVHFYSDYSVNKAGFNMTYKVVDGTSSKQGKRCGKA